MSHQHWTPLIKWNVSPNQIYFLDCCKEKIIPAKLINAAAERIIAEQNGLITSDGNLTSKASIILNEYNGSLTKTKKKVIEDVLGLDCVNRINEYRNIFPNGKLPSGQLAKQNVQDLKAAFVWFFKTYPEFDWDVVLDATEYYVATFEKKNYLYMATSKYFIKKDDKFKNSHSILADYCQQILDNPKLLENI